MMASRTRFEAAPTPQTLFAVETKNAPALTLMKSHLFIFIFSSFFKCHTFKKTFFR